MSILGSNTLSTITTKALSGITLTATTLLKSTVPIDDLAMAKALKTGHEEFHARYPGAATNRTLTGDTSPQFHWRLG